MVVCVLYFSAQGCEHEWMLRCAHPSSSSSSSSFFPNFFMIRCILCLLGVISLSSSSLMKRKSDPTNSQRCMKLFLVPQPGGKHYSAALHTQSHLSLLPFLQWCACGATLTASIRQHSPCSLFTDRVYLGFEERC